MIPHCILLHCPLRQISIVKRPTYISKAHTSEACNSWNPKGCTWKTCRNLHNCQCCHSEDHTGLHCSQRPKSSWLTMNYSLLCQTLHSVPYPGKHGTTPHSHLFSFHTVPSLAKHSQRRRYTPHIHFTDTEPNVSIHIMIQNLVCHSSFSPGTETSVWISDTAAYHFCVSYPDTEPSVPTKHISTIHHVQTISWSQYPLHTQARTLAVAPHTLSW